MQPTLSALETALALAAGAASAQPSTTFKGKGFGTYYYDIQQRQACGTDFNNQDLGSVMRNSNLVAMSNLPLKTAAGLAKYCGKRVVVTVNGVKSNVPFFIGDGLRTLKLSPLACQNGHVDIEYEIVAETLYHFDTN
ncbi:hypothetical protein ISF_05238 [Cordyceps fumosorosea ARSEF 2679]|uniref:Uncharacterized protein n=1 Tax=Cordyceps fumosorosea (strain ARSEF 2679) TaxID=1081104 RepID=A0A167V508_CORFA|nr:hypothetical protein ISF_05238 [Cordyceps fumosorosea ARSEF 2679]OAA62229.1 hypothetical protein ISF_05238 [Cordyceps fumosorosea ARSEF 2679]